jgi:hypothetical protein
MIVGKVDQTVGYVDAIGRGFVLESVLCKARTGLKIHEQKGIKIDGFADGS